MKISVIMQVYLGEYPGSRSDSDKKFLRAVQSFIDQSDKDSELVLVSDGCMVTHNLYYKHFKDNNRIKYAYVDKDTPNMYEGDVQYFRGIPRQVGRSIATGEIITYMDSDDFLLGDYITGLRLLWTKYNEKDWGINLTWYDNKARQSNPLKGEEQVVEDSSNEKLVQIPGLPDFWYTVKMKKDRVPMQTWVLSHRAKCNVAWRDVQNIGMSEDVDFSKRLRNEYTNGFFYLHPAYVRCHYSNLWDY